jgi:hypothetical protein
LRSRAPLSEVSDVFEVDGPRGGTLHVLMLGCGCFTTRRLKAGAPPPEQVPCIACFVAKQVRERAAKNDPAPEPLPMFTSVRDVRPRGEQHIALVTPSTERTEFPRFDVVLLDRRRWTATLVGIGLPLPAARKVADGRNDGGLG